GYMKGINDFCNSYGAGFLYIMVPSKETIYPEYYANGYEVSDQESRAEKIHDALTENGVKHIYLKEIFDTIKTEERLYNKYYDVGHWNSNGIYHCMEELSAILSRDYPEIRKINLNDFELTGMKQEYLPLSLQRKEEIVPVYTPKINNLKGDGMSFFEKELVCRNGDSKYRFHAKREDKGKLPKILVFNDSFFEESDAEKYFLNQYSELTMVHIMNIADVEYYVSSLKPDIVIFEGCERSYESEGVYDLKHLKRKCFIKDVNEDEFEIRQIKTGLTISEGISEDGNKTEFIKVSGHVENMPDPDMLMTSINGRTYYAYTNRDYYDGKFVFSINREETDLSDYDGELIINCVYEK
nr:hypothetical protein [Lachnospiraceae bacterium]